MTEEELTSLKFSSPEEAKAKGYNNEMCFMDMQTHEESLYRLRCFYRPVNKDTLPKFIKQYPANRHLTPECMEVWYQYVKW